MKDKLNISNLEYLFEYWVGRIINNMDLDTDKIKIPEKLLKYLDLCNPKAKLTKYNEINGNLKDNLQKYMAEIEEEKEKELEKLEEYAFS